MSEKTDFIRAFTEDISLLVDLHGLDVGSGLRRTDGYDHDAAFTRLLITSAVQTFEALLSEWPEKEFYKAYKSKSARNEDRARALAGALRYMGAEVDSELIEDFLALKYLRNTLQHYQWKDDEAAHVKQRGFPTNVREFSRADWDRTREVLRGLVGCLNGALFDAWIDGMRDGDSTDERFFHPDDVAITLASDQGWIRSLLTRERLPARWWGNLEAIEREYTGREPPIGETRVQIADIACETLRQVERDVGPIASMDEAYEILLRALREAGARFAPLGMPVVILTDAIASGKLVVGQGLSGIFAQFDATIQDLPRNAALWHPSVPEEVQIACVAAIRPGTDSSRRLAAALVLGQRAYGIVRNQAALSVFLQVLPPHTTDSTELSECRRGAIAAWNLASAWYELVDRGALRESDVLPWRRAVDRLLSAESDEA